MERTFLKIERLPLPSIEVKLQRSPLPKLQRSPLPKLQRSSLPKEYVPTFKGPIEGFAIKYISKNMWRIAAMFEFKDLQQDAYTLFLKIKKKYVDDAELEDRVVHPAHFMALYKTTLTNHVTVLASKVSLNRLHLYDEKMDHDFMQTIVSKAMGDDQNAGYLNILIQQASPNIRALLDMIVNRRRELELAWKRHKASGGKADVGNVFLCKLLGLNPLTVNVVKEVKEYFRRD